MGRRALVLGSGGVTGLAWELGVLEALAARDQEFGPFDLVVGTSCGAFVGSWLVTGRIAEGYRAELEREASVAEVELHAALGSALAPLLEFGRRHRRVRSVPWAWAVATIALAMGRLALTDGVQATRETVPTIARMLAHGLSVGDDLVRLGRLAATSPVADGDTWVAYWRSRTAALGQDLAGYPTLVITAVDVASGELVVFDKDSVTDLGTAVAASTAIALAVSPVGVGESRHMDAAGLSTTHCDVVLDRLPDASHVLVIAPSDNGTLDAEVDRLRLAGAEVTLIRPGGGDAALGRAFGRLDPHMVAHSARRGRLDALAAPQDVVPEPARVRRRPIPGVDGLDGALMAS